MTDLKPCPICGSPAKHSPAAAGGTAHFAEHVYCTDCGIHVHPPEPIERWNNLPRLYVRRLPDANKSKE